MSSGVGAANDDLVDTRGVIAASWAEIDRCVESLPIQAALSELDWIRSNADAREAALLAARLESGVSPRAVESLLQKNDKTSKRSAKARTRRARAVKENPAIANKMKTGDLSPEQADVIAMAADKTDGAAAKDSELVERVAATPPDQARKVADEWVREHTSKDQVQDRHDRQRRLRNIRRWVSERGTDVLALEGDAVSIDRVEQAIRNRSAHLYRADGGRDLPVGRHPRTRDQRNFDAAVELLTGNSGRSGDAGSDSDKLGRGSTKPGPRSTIIVTMTVEQATGVDPSPVQQVGGGLLPPTVLAEMFCEAELVGLVANRHGLPLWLGRTTRYFTKEQVLALIERDRGCAWCRAHYSLCEAHHIIPWEAPARGPTDIDNGVMVCSDCHHWLHDHDLILVRDPDTGTWSTRVAQPHEIAPKRRPDRSQRETKTARSEHRRPRLHERHRTGALW